MDRIIFRGKSVDARLQMLEEHVLRAKLLV